MEIDGGEPLSPLALHALLGTGSPLARVTRLAQGWRVPSGREGGCADEIPLSPLAHGRDRLRGMKSFKKHHSLVEVRANCPFSQDSIYHETYSDSDVIFQILLGESKKCFSVPSRPQSMAAQWLEPFLR